MPWQQHVADVALEVDPATGRLKYRRVILTVPRQSGKTTLILALFAHRALGFGSRQVMTYAAQTGVDARKKFIDEHVPLLEGSLLKPLFRVRKTNGHEAVLWQNGSRHHISAGTEKSGHGATLDLAVVDEAFAQPDGRLEQAFSPAMVTRPEPQLWSVSTAGKPTDEWFFAKIKAGRALADGTDGTAYFEWSAPTDADPHDPAVWASCMPALGHTVTEDVIRAELAAFEAEDKVGEFRRAYLNQWVQQEASSVVDLDAWNDRRTKHHEPVRPVFSVEVATDRSTATIGAAWRVDGTPHVEIVEDRPGTEWVPARIDELRSKYGYANVVVDASSEAASLVPALEALGLSVVKVGGAERAAACGSFYDLVTSARLTHNGDPAVLQALGMARWRDVGEGARVFSRRRSSGDIAALYAVALALHGLMVAPPPREFWGAIA
jgi:phage terminase large subunit-like protein